MHLYRENIEKSFSQNVLKTYGWNSQCKIIVQNLLVTIKMLTPGANVGAQGKCWRPGLSALAPRLYTCIKLRNYSGSYFLCNGLTNFLRFYLGPAVKGTLIQFIQMLLYHWTRWPPCPYMVKHLKIFSRIKLALRLNFGIKHRGSRSTKFVQMMT